ncbi:hypothetical protein [Undibacterium curvum]|uniref:Uncharacterized protein n=1 Tax=Undibacterium curvum TaxID=2762294 RepID=A0ABR7A596_9BURK|nr:hypothetical protein [Undibacterium curvum]MBC3931933.1 hypothetical protein [Undibacterium curvum]
MQTQLAEKNVAYSEEKMKQKIALFAWFAASLIVLGWWYYQFGLNPELSRTLRNESQIYLIIGMAVLSFPSGLLYLYLFGLLVYGLDSVGVDLHKYEMLEVLILWGGIVLSGYLQFFILFPFVRENFRFRQAQKSIHH